MHSTEFITTLFLLLCGHAIADFALQTEWIATNKARSVRLKFSPEQRASMQIIWPYLLTAHALHHGAMVFLVTQRLSFAVAETIVHWCSDFAKCEKWIGFHVDQAIHIASKVAWAAIIAAGR
jgi:hypothetical protein